MANNVAVHDWRHRGGVRRKRGSLRRRYTPAEPWEAEYATVVTKKPRLDDRKRMVFLEGIDWDSVPLALALIETAPMVYSCLDLVSRMNLRMSNWTTMRVGGMDKCWENMPHENVWGLPPQTNVLTLCAYFHAHQLNLCPSLHDRLEHLVRERNRAEVQIRNHDRKAAHDYSLWYREMQNIADMHEEFSSLSPDEHTLREVERFNEYIKRSSRNTLNVKKRLVAVRIKAMWWQRRHDGLLNGICTVRHKLKRLAVFQQFPPMSEGIWSFYDRGWEKAGSDVEGDKIFLEEDAHVAPRFPELPEMDHFLDIARLRNPRRLEATQKRPKSASKTGISC